MLTSRTLSNEAAPARRKVMRLVRKGSFPLACVGLVLGLLSATALETKRVPLDGSVESFRSAADAVRAGVREYNAGDKLGAAKALEYAATQGHALALWKLGRMYADGDGVPHDDLKAFEYFSRIADGNAEENLDSPNAGVIANAYVMLGTYFLEGIKGTYVTAEPARAHELFHYAASYLGDPKAQYSLGRLYLDGIGVEPDARQAARWLNLAAEKGHTSAQALLGHLLVTGAGVPRQPARGLMWLTMAREAADPVKDRWIARLYDGAFETAGPGERQAALAQLEQFLKRRR